VHGEVKEPMVRDWKRDLARVHVPREWLTIDRDAINRDCAATDKFTLSGCCPRPFEQLQFIRGTEDLYCDLMESSRELRAFIREMHQFYCELLSAWARTDCDCLCFMDDWGSQRTLLISPELWRSVFKPMYRDYGQIARSAGKKLHMHSDGHILSILEDLIEVGVDAINSQLFSMGIEAVKPFAGRITFWGEIDRQRMLPSATRAEIDQAVRAVYANLWRNGGCVGQCEFGPGAKPENVRQVFESWNKVMR
jgi:uroporphyrinogen-III decarboxylase